jgi:alkyl hydroperoxide reductase subunit AhpC
MSIQVASPAPAFKTQALVGKEFKTISSTDYAGKWVLLMFYPMDFTFICPTELVGLNDKHGDFADRDCVVLAASTDTVHSHLGWTKADARLSNLKYPLLADVTKSISRSYGVLLEDQGIALRGTFLIDPNGVLRWACVNDDSAGRSIEEMLRVLDALQTDKLCPCNWKKGDATLS